MLRTLLLYLALFSVFGCKQTDKQEVQEQFRERQEAARRQENTQPAQNQTQPTQQPTTAQQPATNQATIPGDRVIAVKDGDTFELLQNGQPVTVRLYGIDAPEKNQPFGQRSRQFASDMAFGKNVRLIVHNKDRYGRTVGTLILPDGRSLNEELIREGFAWHYKAYSKDQNLANLEADARRFKRGLWSEPNPVAPWDFRKNERSLNAAKKAKAETAKQNAPLPAGAATRKVYICNSSGSAVYHFSKNCSVLKRCKAEVLTITEVEAIQKYSRRADKTCSN